MSDTLTRHYLVDEYVVTAPTLCGIPSSNLPVFTYASDPMYYDKPANCPSCLLLHMLNPKGTLCCRVKGGLRQMHGSLYISCQCERSSTP